MRIEQDMLNVARRHPERSAVITGQRTLTYADLSRAVIELAGQLRRTGVAAGTPVWIVLPNGSDFIVAVLAVVRSGGVSVPINPRLNDHEIARVFAVCPPGMVLCGLESVERFVNLLEGEDRPVPLAALAGATLTFHAPKQPVDVPPEHAIHTPAGDPGIIYCTSGSTGRPKAILLTHTNIVANARASAQAFKLKPDDRTLVCMPMGHAYTLTKQMLAHLSVGATLVVGPDRFQPAAVANVLTGQACTTFCGVPSMYVMLDEYIRRYRPIWPALRLLVNGGAPMPPPVQRHLIETLPLTDFISSYGLSEAAPNVCALDPALALVKIGSVGPPIPGVSLRIVDEDDEPLPVGRIGEVCVRGPNVMAGYLNDPDATARVLRNAWLHTCDLGYLDLDGCLYLCGRRDDLILRGGENIYPVEIENVLCDHPAVQEAAVFEQPHPVLGGDLIALVVPREGCQINHQDLRLHGRQFLTTFKMPRLIRSVDSLPKTANGKILRRLLPETFARMESAVSMPRTGGES